jgi:hypothetical protein
MQNAVSAANMRSTGRRLKIKAVTAGIIEVGFGF